MHSKKKSLLGYADELNKTGISSQAYHASGIPLGNVGCSTRICYLMHTNNIPNTD